MKIHPPVFYGLLDCLAGQFYAKSSAICAGESFGYQMINTAKDFFSVALIEEELDNDLSVLGVLSDDSAYKPGKKSVTFVIFIDKRKINNKYLRALFSLILAHEICHFAFYYELFFNLGGRASSRVFNNFIHSVSGAFDGIITEATNITYQTVADEHSISELIFSFGAYPAKHFAINNSSEIDYREHFFHYLLRLKFREILKDPDFQD